MTLYDISPELHAATPVWPGDTPLERQILLDRARGDSVTLSTLRATVHLGAHADAFNHVNPSGPSIGHHPLESYLGPCELIDVCVGHERISADMPHRRTDAPRVLLRTRSADPYRGFPTSFASLSPELVERLAREGVRLIGIDTPSVDPFDSKTLDAHHACVAHQIAILEGLALAHVPEGRYELIALPLRLMDFDASPVRAVLRSLPDQAPQLGTRT